MHRLHGKACLGGGGKVVLVELAATQMGQARFELLAARCLEHAAHRPIFAAAKGLDLHLAVGDDPKCDRLHAACRFRAGQLAPQDGAEVEPHEIVERAARQIGLDQLHIDLAGVFHRLGHGGFGDRVEDHAADGGARLDRLAAGQRLLQVPADRLALAVGVGGEDQNRVIFQRIGDGFDMFARVGGNLPLHRETLFGVDRAILGGQVTHMPIRGQHSVIAAKIAVDGLGLGGRFDDDDGHVLISCSGRGPNGGGPCGRCGRLVNASGAGEKPLIFNERFFGVLWRRCL